MESSHYLETLTHFLYSGADPEAEPRPCPFRFRSTLSIWLHTGGLLAVPLDLDVILKVLGFLLFVCVAVAEVRPYFLAQDILEMRFAVGPG